MRHHLKASCEKITTGNAYRAHLASQDQLDLKYLSDLLLSIRDNSELDPGERLELLALVDDLIWSTGYPFASYPIPSSF